MERAMNTGEVGVTLAALLGELVNGTPPGGGYMLNPGDRGLLASLDGLSAEAASRTVPGGSSIAAHADHLLYGLGLMNRWADGDENPWATADWTLSWTRTTVDEASWSARRAALRDAAQRWVDALQSPREVNAAGLAGMIASVAHLAYHLGAIRQMDRSIRGPGATE
jgi:hypothetical protein